MDGQLDLRTALMLVIGAAVMYMSLNHPRVGTALLVGIGTVTLLHLLLKDR
ncbi:hypothetical protein ACFYVL_42990 [Streptomyces sp. NPDC004111]|uniref:hypothetical protein n=1 Tax=Streptomyces sp. NPDC004111 TaxID=3364690 RepID=UPI0036C4DB49